MGFILLSSFAVSFFSPFAFLPPSTFRLPPFLLSLSTFHPLPSCYALETSPNPKALFKQADVVLEVIPLRARPIESGASVDAVESDLSRLALAEAVVSFKVRRVLKGEWKKVKVGGPSRMDQMGEAVRKKDYKKMFGITDPNQEVEKSWVSIAVEDPGKAFGINQWDAPEPSRMKVYFKRLPENKDSLVLIGTLPS